MCAKYQSEPSYFQYVIDFWKTTNLYFQKKVHNSLFSHNFMLKNKIFCKSFFLIKTKFLRSLKDLTINPNQGPIT